MTQNAFFLAGAGPTDSFVATIHTRGPWSPDHQHAGPPAALLGRAVEAALPAVPAMQVVRMTFEILRPVPIASLRIETTNLHAGRSVRVIDATLLAEDKPLIRARALALRSADVPIPDTPRVPLPPKPAQATAFEFPFFNSEQGYHRAMETRLARGEFGSGDVAAWMRMRIPLVAGETPTALQRVLTAADSGSGVSAMLDLERYTFLNPDLTVYLHRLPVGEWVCLEAATLPQANGIGLADTRLHDEQGAIGRCAQSLIIQAS